MSCALKMHSNGCWSCEITWQTKNITTTVPLTSKLGRMVNYLDWNLPESHMTLWWRGLAKSRDKLKPLYLHNHSVYDHQTCKDGDLPWGAPSDKVTRPFGYVVMQNHMTNWNHHNSATTVSFVSKRCRIVTYVKGLLSIKSHDLLNTWSCKITWQIKTFISPLPQCIWQPNLVGCWLT